jgi:hypothetical protein
VHPQRADFTAALRADIAGHFAYPYAALEPVEAFVPRRPLHNQIHAQLAHNAADSNTRTQLVLDYVRQHRNNYKATFWIEAGRKESPERDCGRLY